MKTRNDLEEKIKFGSGWRNKIAAPLTVGIVLLGSSYLSSCGDESTPSDPPSDYCCNEEMKCGLEGNPPLCVGEGDDCYCRNKTCCEEKACGSGYSCVEGDMGGGCICQRDQDDVDVGGYGGGSYELRQSQK